jgi:hypothetical protein
MGVNVDVPGSTAPFHALVYALLNYPLSYHIEECQHNNAQFQLKISALIG